MSLAEKYAGRWLYCELCREFAIRCLVCRNLSCNGGGCPACAEAFAEVNAGDPHDHPPLDEVPFLPMLPPPEQRW